MSSMLEIHTLAKLASAQAALVEQYADFTEREPSDRLKMYIEQLKETIGKLHLEVQYYR